MCRCPNWAWKRYNPITGKYIVRPFRQVDKDNDNVELMRTTFALHGEQLIQLPCGKCVDCRLKYSAEWADRCMLEAKENKNNYFITLTYDNEHVPKGFGIMPDTGEVYESLTLKPKDMSDFIKRLRRHYEYRGAGKIRFYGCGEYGEKYCRPHYHIILYNCKIDDLKPDHRSKKGNMNYVSETISKIWGKGRIGIGNVTWDSCAYTARYVMKKQKGKMSQEYYKLLGVVPEFVRMSRRPGIGRDYYDKKKDTIYETDEMWLNTTKGIKRAKPARYYDKLFDLDNHEQLQEIKKRRKETAEMREKMLFEQNPGMLPSEILQAKWDAKDESIKSLKRKFDKNGI